MPPNSFPLDITEALPLPSVAFLSKNDIVCYERLNDAGEVIMFAVGKVINLNSRTQQVQVRVSGALRFWVSVECISLMKAANQAAYAA